MKTPLSGLDRQTRALVERLSEDPSPAPSIDDIRAPLAPHMVQELAPRDLLDVADVVVRG